MSNHPEICFDCNEGHYDEVKIDYPVQSPSMDEPVVLKNLVILRCNKCGEELMPREASKRIDEIIMKRIEKRQI